MRLLMLAQVLEEWLWAAKASRCLRSYYLGRGLQAWREQAAYYRVRMCQLLRSGRC